MGGIIGEDVGGTGANQLGVLGDEWLKSWYSIYDYGNLVSRGVAWLGVGTAGAHIRFRSHPAAYGLCGSRLMHVREDFRR